MKKILPLWVFFSVNYLDAQQTKILWIGNSYTSVNNLPALFHDLALSGGDSVTYDSNTPGGYTLQQQSIDATCIQKIYSQPWDYVIIQAQSQEPSFSPSQVAQQTFPYAHVLDSLIRDNDSCTETIFYMTWGKKYGDQQNCAFYPAICTFEGVQDRLRDSYIQMADNNHALVAPVGMAWNASWHTDTVIDLWQADFSHPNIAGSYLAACVFYGTIFRKSPVGIMYSPISASVTNDYLQNIAYHTVFDSLKNWNIGVFDPKASFTYSGDEITKTYQFSAISSSNYSDIQWNCGDGNSGNGIAFSHIYSDTGTYTMTLIVYDNCGGSDTLSQTFTIDGASGIGEAIEEKFSVCPNPVSNDILQLFAVKKAMGSELKILDVSGKEVFRSEIKNHKSEFDLRNLNKGVYFLKLNGETKKFLKL